MAMDYMKENKEISAEEAHNPLASLTFEPVEKL